jgi:hypothetical protein
MAASRIRLILQSFGLLLGDGQLVNLNTLGVLSEALLSKAHLNLAFKCYWVSPATGFYKCRYPIATDNSNI